MTTAELARWSVIVIMGLGNLIMLARVAKEPRTDGAAIVGTVVGVLIRIWLLVAVIVWWQP